MATNLAIDPGLLEAAHKISSHRTKKATVTEALQEYIQRRQQRHVLDLFGTIDYDEDFDFTHLRSSEHSAENYKLAASGFLAEIDRMQLAVREFLWLHPDELASTSA